MTRRERVMKALAFEAVDRVPLDLGGMNSTGVSCFAYPGLVKALGLPPRRPRIHDTGQMLALPDTDVLDALDCDVATVHLDVTNAYEQPGLWHPYDFNGRLDALVCHPEDFSVLDDGSIKQGANLMPPASHVFESEHGGQPLILTGDIPKPDLNEIRKQQQENALTDERVKAIAEHCRRAREATGRAILFNGIGAGIGIGGFTGIAMFPMLCLTEPEFVLELHETVVGHNIAETTKLLEAVHPYVDIYMCCPDDWGTQNQTVASPETYRSLFKPFYQRFNDAVRQAAPNIKTFLHCCGAVYDLIDDFVESGFDALNPVQWTAGGHSYAEWKDKARGRIALWGGGVNAQATLPLGSLEDVKREVSEIVPYLVQDSGFVFCAIHNLLAEIPGDKIAAMYQTAARASKR